MEGEGGGTKYGRRRGRGTIWEEKGEGHNMGGEGGGAQYGRRETPFGRPFFGQPHNSTSIILNVLCTVMWTNITSLFKRFNAFMFQKSEYLCKLCFLWHKFDCLIGFTTRSV